MLALSLSGVPASAQSPLPEGVEVEKVADGFRFTEGPHWHSDGFLLFSDIPANTIYRWHPDSSAAEVYRRPSGNSNGLAADGEGRLLLAQHGWRRIARVAPDGQESALVTHYEGRRLNSPNDLAVASDGAIYFTDPPFGVADSLRELNFSGVYRLAPDSTLTLLTDAFSRPNGIVLSPDESRLYVNDSRSSAIRVYGVAADGSVSDGRLFAEMDDPDAEGVPDGMVVDAQGNVYSTGPGGVWIFAPDGTLLDRLAVPQRATNVTLGGPDGRTLFITASTAVYRLRLNAPDQR